MSSPRLFTKHQPAVLAKAGLLCIVVPLLLLTACAKRDQAASIKLPPTPILTPQNQWAVVNAEHLRLRSGPTIDSKYIFTLWRGYVVKVLDRSPQPESVGSIQDYWYYINYGGLQGWVFGYYLDLFDSRQQADQSAKEME